jgi:hypothetical protein
VHDQAVGKRQRGTRAFYYTETVTTSIIYGIHEFSYFLRTCLQDVVEVVSCHIVVSRTSWKRDRCIGYDLKFLVLKEVKGMHCLVDDCTVLMVVGYQDFLERNSFQEVRLRTSR